MAAIQFGFVAGCLPHTYCHPAGRTRLFAVYLRANEETLVEQAVSQVFDELRLGRSTVAAVDQFLREMGAGDCGVNFFVHVQCITHRQVVAEDEGEFGLDAHLLSTSPCRAGTGSMHSAGMDRRKHDTAWSR